jgi:biopolymer transport protein ExbD
LPNWKKMKFEIQHKPLASFSFSSLTDIVLLLLIFFLLTSQFVINNGVQVNLPKTKNSDEAAKTLLIVTINSTGQIYFSGKSVTKERLSEIFNERKNKSKSLIIRADKETALEHVVSVIDIARGAGIIKFTVQTEKAN